MNAAVFHALGDPTRLKIVSRLCRDGLQPLGHLTEGLGMSRQAATKHVRALQGAGIVDMEPRGRECVCRLRAEQLRQAELWIAGLAAEWETRLEALKALVES
ncbi:MAG: helix-turn-helix transcriptional regulator [Chthonomonadaceae bacterium]|nr:helix-turn-helix transcriptional regulator [Chthonomonadaceae bacterium]